MRLSSPSRKRLHAHRMVTSVTFFRLSFKMKINGWPINTGMEPRGKWSWQRDECTPSIIRFHPWSGCLFLLEFVDVATHSSRKWHWYNSLIFDLPRRHKVSRDSFSITHLDQPLHSRWPIYGIEMTYRSLIKRSNKIHVAFNPSPVLVCDKKLSITLGDTIDE